jgi:hypothetical protein
MKKIIAIIGLIAGGALAVSAQTPNRGDWGGLGDESVVVVVGVVEEQTLVVHKDKLDATQGIPDFQQVVAGRAYRVRVEEVLKGGRRARAGRSVHIFVPGSHLTEGTAAMAEGRKYVIFLGYLGEEKKQLAGAAVFRPKDPNGAKPAFAADSHFRVVGGSGGVVEVTPQNKDVLGEIRFALRQ